MAIDPGTRLGSYEVVALIGRGGMGEVYRARDTKLGRDAAIKIIPDSFVHDPERLARFRREAQTLASLNHPNIAQIYGLDDSNGTQFIALELVEGGTLADQVARGPVPIDDALPIARQIAAALEAAHEKGIVHRDLKPANVALSADHRSAKVLDFGLAKVVEPSDGSIDGRGLTHSPTITSPMMMTGAGVILGTAAYMSPEQAKGRVADKRSDVWAFGCVLFEMLTGRRAFVGEDVSETLASILRSEPDWSALPPGLPSSITRLMRRCLQKDPLRRLRDIGDARLEIDDAGLDGTSQSVPPPSAATRAGLWIGVSGVAIGTILATVAFVNRPQLAEPPREARFEIQVPALFANGFSIAISPDGRQIAYVADDANDTRVLWLRAMNAVDAHVIAGTDQAANPVFSLDGQSIIYNDQSGRLLQVDVAGGRPQTIATIPRGSGRVTANAAGTILIGRSDGPIATLSRDGGPAAPVLDLDQSSGERSQLLPWFLPDGDHFLYLSRSGSPADGRTAERGDIYVASLRDKTRKRLVASDSMALYAGGFLLFIRNGALIAVRFDPSGLELIGEPIQAVDQVPFNPATGNAPFRASSDGTLVYRSGATELTWPLNIVGRDGKTLAMLAPPAQYAGVSVSPDGKKAAFYRHEAEGGDVWIADLADLKTTRLTFGPSQDNESPVWSPDGSRIVFSSRRQNKWGLYVKASNGVGGETMLTESTDPISAMSWSRDGKVICYMTAGRGGWDLYSLMLDGERRAVPSLAEKHRDGFGQFSPDGRWIAYASNLTGRNEVYVESFPPGQGKWLVSTGGGAFPQWRADGRELFFFSREDGLAALLSVRVDTTAKAFEYSKPQALFETAYFGGPVAGVSGHYLPWATLPDGQRFVIPQRQASSTDDRTTPLTVVLNWSEGLKQRVPAR